MWLRACRDVHAEFPSLGMRWELAAGEEMLTEISVKFDLAELHHELAAHGLGVTRCWTDRLGDFSLSLAAAR
jgi:uncharacterized SAM-dependent methyltransferase